MKKNRAIQTVGLYANPEKFAEAVPLLRQTASMAAGMGVGIAAEKLTAKAAGLEALETPDVASLARRSDLLLAFGGDGTILGIARAAAGLNTPILGVNLGGLGFLTGLQAHDMDAMLPGVLEGRFELDARPLIEASGGGGREFLQTAMNDFVVTRGASTRLIELEVAVDGDVVTHYRADGLIVSTPTGSTAYSLAAGGAVVVPNAAVLSITPICPHTLSNRSLLVSMDSVVRITVLSEKPEVFLNADGQVQVQLETGDQIDIRRSAHLIGLARLPGNSFFKTLRQKLNWRGSSV